jgi:GNAT superfamily N-acetyltransferase
MTEVSIEPFTRAHVAGLIALVAAEGWTEYSEDVERTHRALTAPGVTTLVAIAGGHVVGAIHVQSDGLVQAHVSMLLIDRTSRGAGLGSRLLRQGLDRAGGLQLDVRSRPRATTSGLARAARSASALHAKTSGSMAPTLYKAIVRYRRTGGRVITARSPGDVEARTCRARHRPAVAASSAAPSCFGDCRERCTLGGQLSHGCVQVVAH